MSDVSSLRTPGVCPLNNLECYACNEASEATGRRMQVQPQQQIVQAEGRGLGQCAGIGASTAVLHHPGIP